MTGRNIKHIIAGIMVAFWLCTGLFAQDATHIVQKGETLYGIAKSVGCTIQDLLALNHLTATSSIKVGQKLLVPGKTEAPVPTARTASPQPDYIVKKGDTLFGIARQNNIELKNLLKINGLTEKSGIVVGQRLKLAADAAIAQASNPPPSPSPKASPVASPSASSDPVASQSVNMTENTAQASEGTMLKTKPYNLGATLSWPHPGERLLVDGKLPGLLIRAAKGDVVKAVADGKVLYSGPHSTLGHIVFVQNSSGFIYIYGGNEDSALKAGDLVKTGDQIGRVGQTPGFSEPEVFFSTWKDGAYIDPSSAPRG